MICSRCVYTDKIPFISFDKNGVCNYCHQHDELNKEYPTGEEGLKKLLELSEKIKKSGRGEEYDVVVGVSGGTDSSYMLWLAKELGLRPLAAHFDNTWNSKIAVKNIQNICKNLDVDLFTHVVDNIEYNDIYKSLLLAGVPECDIAADIGLATTHYLACEKHKIKYIFEGHSFRTEGITPHGWVYMDGKYIESVHKLFGKEEMKTFPNLWLKKWLKWTLVDRVKKVRPLYYIDYDKEKTKEFLKSELGWNWYGGHHMENRTSYFANNYFLPVKFGIDIRIVEYAALVREGQMKRKDALDNLKVSMDCDISVIEEVKKRLSFTNEEFTNMMNSKKKSHLDYETYKRTFEKMKPLFWVMYKLNLVPKSFYMKYTKNYE